MRQRKVFISFLGTSNYRPTLYKDSSQSEQEVRSTRFIQESLVELYCSDFSSDDKILILTTEEALHNWQENRHKGPKEEEEYESLQSRLKSLDLNCQAENIIIPKGGMTEEIWGIFQIVFDQLQENDELYFDITHGFRSLSMLNMVLINYAKLLKNISVKGIYYGNWEARYISNGKMFSPIWNLTDFTRLQEWTNAAQMFLKTGNGLELADLLEKRALKDSLEQFSKFILVNRGVNIYKGDAVLTLKKELGRVLRSEVEAKNKPLLPILEKVEHEFKNYKKDDVLNGFYAVTWSIKNGLIQQATTMLEESITTFILSEIGEIDKIQDPDIRQSASSALVVKKTPFRYREVPNKDDGIEERVREKAQRILNWEKVHVPKIQDLEYRDALSKIVEKIKTELRNDINHAGFRKDPKSYKQLKGMLKDYYRELQAYFKDNRIIVLPDLD